MRKSIFFFVESNGGLPPCPICQGQLKYRDKRIRVRKKEAGEKQWLLIDRYRCEDCGRYHNALPDCLAPYKHYETEVIAGVLDGAVSPDDMDSEDYPSSITMLRWLAWLQYNLANIEGFLRRAGFLLHGFGNTADAGKAPCLAAIRSSSPCWLEMILRTIYNSGGVLPALWY